MAWLPLGIRAYMESDDGYETYFYEKRVIYLDIGAMPEVS